MKKFLLSCAAVAFSMSAFAEDVVLFEDNFEWFNQTNIDTYTSGGKNVSDNVGAQMYSGAYNPKSTTLKTPDGETVWDLLIKKGYNMESTTEDQAKASVGCAKYYIKMAITTYTAKLILPKMPAAGEGIRNVRLSFDWTPMTDGGKALWDKTAICIEIINGENTKIIPIDPINKQDGFVVEGDKTSGAKTPYQWHNVNIDLDGYTINKDTRIALRNADPDYPQTQTTGEKKRWFLDNIKVYTTGSSMVGEITSEDNAPVEYFNLQGVKVANPENGVYIRRQGTKTAKVVMK